MLARLRVTPPALNRQEALIKIGNYIDDLEVFAPKILMKRRRFMILW